MPTPSRCASLPPKAIELAIRLLEAHHPPEKVQAALVYQGHSKETARELVQGILNGRIDSPPGENDERTPADWALLPAPFVLALGLVLFISTVCMASIGRIRIIHLGGLMAGFLISCAGLERITGPKRHRLSRALCLLLIFLATAAICFLHLLV